MAGRLLGIARKARPGAEVEEVSHAAVGLDTGIAGDFRGAIRPGKSGRRQVSILQAEDWTAALAELGQAIEWRHRRANLLVQGLDLPRSKGVRLRIGDLVLEVTGECDPCRRMEKVAPGLEAVLIPHWRGGRLAKVLAAGDITVGDDIIIEEQA